MDLPAPVIEALATYRRLRNERGWDWGGEALPQLFRFARFTRLGPLLEAVGETGGDWAAAVRTVVGETVPAGMVVVHVDGTGIRRVVTGRARLAVAGRPVPLDVVIDSTADAEVVVRAATHEVTVAAGGATLVTVDVDGPFTITCGADAREVDDAVRRVPATRLRLRSSGCSRWSVTDASGGAWFPEDAPRKFDVHHRPFFHGHDVTLPVPAEPLVVRCGRGLEFGVAEADVHPAADGNETVALEPPRRIDPAADGWFGGDLHAHLNYSGDLVCTPSDAERMQRGEGLHLLQLTAGNLNSSLVYDRELFEATAGRDLPWSDDAKVARAGVEFRNDLLGHVHALGVTGPPSRYHTGHEGTDEPNDWPPNLAACRELGALGGVVAYAHPVFAPFGDDWSTDAFLASPRSVEARELVVDAALGAVDAMDVLSPFDDEASAFLYHRLLSCGLRLAATAGTDVFLSFSHGPGVASNPPGWGRVYADLRDEPLSVAAFADAVRAGRTLVTNGPWLTLDVDGRGPGAVLDRADGDRLAVRATVDWPADDVELTLVGPDGVVAAHGRGVIEVELPVDGPTWFAATVRGPGHPEVLDAGAFAHTTPVHVEVGGDRVARRRDADWCLALLDGVADLVAKHGRFDPARRAAHLADHTDVVERARVFYRDVRRHAPR